MINVWKRIIVDTTQRRFEALVISIHTPNTIRTMQTQIDKSIPSTQKTTNNNALLFGLAVAVSDFSPQNPSPSLLHKNQTHLRTSGTSGQTKALTSSPHSHQTTTNVCTPTSYTSHKTQLHHYITHHGSKIRMDGYSARQCWCFG
jgi:hypothetical protein